MVQTTDNERVADWHLRIECIDSLIRAIRQCVRLHGLSMASFVVWVVVIQPYTSSDQM